MTPRNTDDRRLVIVSNRRHRAGHAIERRDEPGRQGILRRQLEDGVLILSEFAGAAVQLQHDALLVNPYHVEATADALYQAWAMHPEERRVGMQRLRRTLRAQDIFWWVATFLQAGQVAQRDQRPPLGGDVRIARMPQMSSGWRG